MATRVISFRLPTSVDVALRNSAANARLSVPGALDWLLRNSFGNFELLRGFADCLIGWRYWTVVVYRSAGLRGILPAASAEENWLGKLFYLAHILALWAYLTFWNKPDAHRPTGVWARWKEINDRNKAWINEKFRTLDELKSFVGL